MSKINSYSMSRRKNSDVDRSEYISQLTNRINETAGHVRNSMKVFVSITVSLFLVLLASNDESILRDSAIFLPQVGTRIPLSTSYTVAPLLYIFVYVMTVLKLRGLEHLIGSYEQQSSALSVRKKNNFDSLICPFFYINPFLHRHTILSCLIVFIAVYFFPFSLLLGTYVQFLKFGDPNISLLQGVTIAILCLTWFWLYNARSWIGLLANSIKIIMTLLAVVFCVSQYSHRFSQSSNSSSQKYVFIDVSNRTLLQEETSSEIQAVKDDAEGIYLKDRNLSGANFNESKLYNADLRGANLSYATFCDADLFGVKMSSDTELSRATFWGADLSKAHLSGVVLDANFPGANFSYANLSDANLEKINFSSDEWIVTGDNPCPYKADYYKPLKYRADFSYADLSCAKLPNEKSDNGMYNLNLSYANLSCENGMAPRKLSDVNFMHSNLSGANLSGLDLLDAHYFEDANLSGADLSDTKLEAADLSGINLSNAKVHGAKMVFTTFARSDLSGVDLSKVYLQHVNFIGARLATTIGLTARSECSSPIEGLPDFLCARGFFNSKTFHFNNSGPNISFPPTTFPEGFNPEEYGFKDICDPVFRENIQKNIQHPAVEAAVRQFVWKPFDKRVANKADFYKGMCR